MAEDEADGLLGRAAVRPCDSGHGHCDVDAEPRPRALGHGLGGLGGDSAVALEHVGAYAELATFTSLA